MPHFVLEYTSNIKAEADIPGLLKKVTKVLLSQNGLFPPGGTRARAYEAHDYSIADGEEDYAFVHCQLKIGAGRAEADKKKAFDELFEMIKEHFCELYSKRYLAISMEVGEFNEAGTYKHNNLHARFKKNG
jgi:5-carboxymethyl-2-hydroxymuconate isomerase